MRCGGGVGVPAGVCRVSVCRVRVAIQYRVYCVERGTVYTAVRNYIDYCIYSYR